MTYQSQENKLRISITLLEGGRSHLKWNGPKVHCQINDRAKAWGHIVKTKEKDKWKKFRLLITKCNWVISQLGDQNHL